MQSGSLPDSIVDGLMAALGTLAFFDARLNFMCCCGVGTLLHDPYFTLVRCSNQQGVGYTWVWSELWI